MKLFPSYTANPKDIEYTINAILDTLSIPEINDDGDKYWYDEEGGFHRDNGPAKIYRDGAEEYFQHGSLHRLDGPAYIGSNGYKEYWVNGRLHREDAPAVIHEDGKEDYYEHGEPYSGPS